jgi:hypothetical protein
LTRPAGTIEPQALSRWKTVAERTATGQRARRAVSAAGDAATDAKARMALPGKVGSPRRRILLQWLAILLPWMMRDLAVRRSRLTAKRLEKALRVLMAVAAGAVAGDVAGEEPTGSRA